LPKVLVGPPLPPPPPPGLKYSNKGTRRCNYFQYLFELFSRNLIESELEIYVNVDHNGPYGSERFKLF
jgi:hypothetical protein